MSDPLVDESENALPRVVLAETWDGVTKIHFTNVAVHKGSPEPNPVKRRFRADVRYWLMDAKTYEKGDLGIGNPELTEFVRKLGKKSLPASEPTAPSVMPYGIANGILKKYPVIKKDRGAVDPLLERARGQGRGRRQPRRHDCAGAITH